jgi:hypothetical protein
MTDTGLGLYIKAIDAIYNEDVRDEDREKAIIVEPGAATTITTEQVIPTAKVMAEKINRFEALRFIYRNWERNSGEVFDPDLIMLLIETNELLELWTAKSYHSCVLRACSFFENYFIDNTGINERSSFSNSINAAASRGIITDDEKRLYHFVREVRNDCAHNNWLQIEYPTAVLVFACTTSNFLVGELIDRKLREYDSTLSTPVEADPHHFLKKLKEDFQWTCTKNSGNISWEAPDNWEHPEDGKYSSYDRAYQSLLDDDSDQ